MSIFNQLIKVFLESLGISREQQFIGTMLLLIGLFLTYMGRSFVKERVLSVLMLIATLALLLTLSTTEPRTRLIGAIVMASSVAVGFGWYALFQRRREKSERSKIE